MLFDIALGNLGDDLGQLESSFRADGEDIVSHVGKAGGSGIEISKLLGYPNTKETNTKGHHKTAGNKPNHQTYCNIRT